MPRLTDAMYHAQRRRLSHAWDTNPGLFAYLQTFEQRDLHRFIPTRDLYDDDALAYRRQISVERPGLPSQAGRAYARFERMVEAHRLRRAAPKTTPTKIVKALTQRRRVVAVYPIVRPELDVQRIARLLVELSMTSLEKPNNIEEKTSQDGLDEL